MTSNHFSMSLIPSSHFATHISCSMRTIRSALLHLTSTKGQFNHYLSLTQLVSFIKILLFLFPIEFSKCLCIFIYSHFLYPLEIRPGQQSKVTRQTDGQHEVFLELERCVRNQIKRLIMDESFGKFDSSAAVIGANTATCLASSLSRALCYIHRYDLLIAGFYQLSTITTTSLVFDDDCGLI